ncbi:amidohydrolase family protein [Terriglobus saanensis]|nr:amidohydrolase family protein [Terriglobus saanensis]
MRPTRRRAMLLLSLFAALSVRAQTVAPKLIDVHFHYNGEPNVLGTLLEKLNQADGLAVLLITPKGLPEASKFIQAHPNRFVGFGDVNLDDPDIMNQMERFHLAGMLGLGEITRTLKNYDDPIYWPIYERANKYHMILLFHTGIVNRLHPEVAEDVSFDRSRITRLDLIARRWPKLILIGAHLGNPDYAEAAEIGRWDPNLYFDASGTTLLKKQEDYRFFRSIFWWSGVVSPHTPSGGPGAFTKLLFASDVFGGDLNEFDGSLSRYHAMLKACDVSESDQALIFSGTMWRILQQQKEAIAADVLR